MNTSGDINFARPSNSPSLIEREFEADRFAADLIVRTLSTEQTIARNGVMPYLYLRWLEHVETILGKPLSNLHPSPLQRAMAIRKRFSTSSGSGEPDHFAWIDERLPYWKQAKV